MIPLMMPEMVLAAHWRPTSGWLEQLVCYNRAQRRAPCRRQCQQHSQTKDSHAVAVLLVSSRCHRSHRVGVASERMLRFTLRASVARGSRR
ncbi:uncharacterized protein CANTADRAFT_197412 [Suhomyces tanzawaensis NRRL Y-17324]|uniref:Uncharacterized protein n=1 Tax=Suhomyces tanzawaensis NRRL Y-17324 TaxID=984487 RepID=A0A1E4SNZ3_9ASCO|nr:uncharacterized protein CANTADRAFT_197412 [Suhomyces tanzawaensis NRRL Y-17324]ODV81233.1 hypothetical protein CANTADRAFT_197412 [Suhomyces tanzawaensis NRRL Y-17324]